MFEKKWGIIMSLLDIGIVIAYMIAMMVMGLVLGNQNKTQEDYFLAGRSMPWLPVALSVAATMISANSFIGGPGWAYTDGLEPFMQNITVPLACFIAVTVTVPMFYYLRVSSVYEYMELRLGSISRNLAVAQFFINSLIQVSSMVYVPALILQTITGWSINIIVPIVVICAILYTITGGIKAVIWTDVVQMVVLWSGIILILIIAVNDTGLSFSETISQAAAAGKLNAFDFTFTFTKTNAFICSCFGIFMWVRYFCFDQSQMQRILTSKSMKGIKRSLVTSSVLMNLMYFLMLFLGAIFFISYNGKTFATSNEIMIDFILNRLPSGIVGLIVAAVFAAAMSSIDSLFNSMSNVFTTDIYERYILKNKGESTLKQSILFSLIIGIIIIAIVILAFDGTVQSVLDVVGGYISFFAGPSLGAFLLAMFTIKSHDKGVALGVIVGLILGYITAKIFQTSWLVNPAIGAGFTIIFGYIFSILIPSRKNRNEKTYQYTIKGLREKMIEEKHISEENVSILPFSIDKYGFLLLFIFVLQYVILFFISF